VPSRDHSVSFLTSIGGSIPPRASKLLCRSILASFSFSFLLNFQRLLLHCERNIGSCLWFARVSWATAGVCPTAENC
jgi:hypothetical protein